MSIDDTVFFLRGLIDEFLQSYTAAAFKDEQDLLDSFKQWVKTAEVA